MQSWVDCGTIFLLFTEFSKAFWSLRIKLVLVRCVHYSCIVQSRAVCACAIVCVSGWGAGRGKALMTSHDRRDRLIMSPRYCIPLFYPQGGGMFQTNPQATYVHVHAHACMPSHA